MKQRTYGGDIGRHGGTTRVSEMSSTASSATGSSIVAALSEPAAYPEPTKSVEKIETHISWVFLTDRFAYKVKKPVRFDFLDFSTPERRHEACREEMRLNKRLAEEVYLGVVPITRDAAGRVQVAGQGQPLDWAVKMCRLPADRAVDRLIATGRLADGDVDRIAERLTRFYRDRPPQKVDAQLERREIEQHVIGNRQELLASQHGLDAALVKRVHAAQLRVLRMMPEAIDRRVADGRIIDGHGDLRPSTSTSALSRRSSTASSSVKSFGGST